MRYFLDSSALIKRYVPEIGSSWVHRLIASNPSDILVAHITQTEVVSGVMRRQRDNLLSMRSARAVRIVLDRHMSRSYKVLTLTQSIITLSEDLLETYALRAYDAIQLATALEINSQFVVQNIPALTFVSADKRLLEVATAENLLTENPNLYP